MSFLNKIEAAKQERWDSISKAEELLTKAYLELHNLKFDLDKWENEFYPPVDKIYRDTLNLANEVGAVKQKMYQLQMEVSKFLKSAK